MSFVRANPSGWGFGETLTSTQMNTSDAYWPDAVDGRTSALEITPQTVTMRQSIQVWPSFNPEAGLVRLSQGTIVTDSSDPDSFSYMTNIPGDGTLAVVRIGMKHTAIPSSGQGVVISLGTWKNDVAGDSDGTSSTAADSNTFQVVTITLPTPAATTGGSRHTGFSLNYDSTNYFADTSDEWTLYYIECDFTVTKLLDV